MPVDKKCDPDLSTNTLYNTGLLCNRVESPLRAFIVGGNPMAQGYF